MNQYYTVIDEIFVKVETKVSMGCLSPYREPLDARDKPPRLMPVWYTSLTPPAPKQHF